MLKKQHKLTQIAVGEDSTEVVKLLHYLSEAGMIDDAGSSFDKTRVTVRSAWKNFHDLFLITKVFL